MTYSMLVALGIALVGVYLLLRLYDRLPQSESARRKRRAIKPKRRRDTEATE